MSPAPPARARIRSVLLSAGCCLDMNEPLQNRALQKITRKDAFGVGESLGRIDVLPAPVADVKGPEFPLCGEPPHAIGERAVAVLPCGFESFKQRWTAQEHPGIEGVVADKIFSDIDD